jgi:5-methylthioribose kinase
MTHAGPLLLDPANPAEIERYLAGRGLLEPDRLPIRVSPAGAGNMNMALRISPATGRSFIVKQGRPWVEKYPQIPAPFERTLVEAAFYEVVQDDRGVAGLMPAVLDVDPDNHVLVLEDLGGAGDFTSIYGGAAMPAAVLDALLAWLERLATVTVPADRRGTFANRAMRALNHEHMFRFPLAADNGLDLDGITPGLAAAAGELAGDRAYCAAVAAAGRRYLADGQTLVHGDYFPGSWLHAGDGVRVIDPEFCFLGDPEFDCGILAAHLTIARAPQGTLAEVAAAVEARGLAAALVATSAGVEIMRRLIGVAQLPVALDIDQKRSLLRLSHRLVLSPHQGFA